VLKQIDYDAECGAFKYHNTACTMQENKLCRWCKCM